MSEADDRRTRAAEVWEQVTMAPVREATTPFEESLLGFVAPVWDRPGLSRRDRRWVSLSCAAASGQELPIRAHVRAALESGDITADELREFVLHFAVYAGWPRASFVSAVVTEYAPRD
jgi:4-carboxymuconolactone decarboxylase